METPHFHILCITELLRCFPYFGSYLHWLSFSEASCLALQSPNRSWRQCERRLPIRNCHLVKNDPAVLALNNKNLICLLPFTNTWGEAFSNLTVSIIKPRHVLRDDSVSQKPLCKCRCCIDFSWICSLSMSVPHLCLSEALYQCLLSVITLMWYPTHVLSHWELTEKLNWINLLFSGQACNPIENVFEKRISP